MDFGPPAPRDDPMAGARFRTTHWSMIVRAGAGSGTDAHQALERLCQAYWQPVYVFIRRRGYSPADAQDHTQSFFARLLEKDWIRAADASKGRFRTFLLTAVTRFLSNEHERQRALKRGGGAVLLSLDGCPDEAAGIAEPRDSASAEAVFDRRWAETLLSRVMDRLREEMDGGGRQGRFEALKGYLIDDRGAVSYADTARALGMGEAAVKSGIYRLRQRYGEMIREEIGETVDSPSEVDAEIRHLLAALGS